MRSSVPDGDLGAIIEQAVTEKLERLESRRFGRTSTPRKALQRATPLQRPARSQPPSSEPCTSATEAGATTSTSRAGDAPRAKGSSSTTVGRSAAAVTTPWGTSRSCVGPTTPAWPRSTTAEGRWLFTGTRESGSSSPPCLHRGEPRPREHRSQRRRSARQYLGRQQKGRSSARRPANCRSALEGPGGRRYRAVTGRFRHPAGAITSRRAGSVSGARVGRQLGRFRVARRDGAAGMTRARMELLGVTW